MIVDNGSDLPLDAVLAVAFRVGYDFLVGLRREVDPVVVGVSTQGRVLVGSAPLRDGIETLLDGASEFAAFVDDLRDRLDEREVASGHRRDVLTSVAVSDSIRTLVTEGETDRAHDAAVDALSGIFVNKDINRAINVVSEHIGG